MPTRIWVTKTNVSNYQADQGKKTEVDGSGGPDKKAERLALAQVSRHRRLWPQWQTSNDKNGSKTVRGLIALRRA